MLAREVVQRRSVLQLWKVYNDPSSKHDGTFENVLKLYYPRVTATELKEWGGWLPFAPGC